MTGPGIRGASGMPIEFFADPATLPQVHRGRHGLTPNQVRHNQRERLLVAIIETTGITGYLNVSVGDFIKAAGVSRKTFYELFADKDDAFCAAVTTVTTAVRSAMRAAAAPAATWPAAVIAGIDQLAPTALAHPLAVRACLIDGPTVPPTAALLNDLAEEAVAFLNRGRAGVPHPEAVAAGAAHAALGAIRQTLLAGELTMRHDLVHAALDPFLGPGHTARLL